MDSIFLHIETAAHGGAFGNNPMPTPTDAQCQAGNYKLGRVSLYGLEIAIEQPRGTYRTGIDSKTGKQWSSRMAAHYGYFSGTKGNDGDGVDCFVGFYPQSDMAYVINQNVGGKFDEHKTMLAFTDEESARRAYQDSYERGWSGLESIIPVSISQLKWWLKHGDMSKPLRPANLPPKGLETMTKKVLWNSEALPYDQTIDQVLYDIRRADAGEGLLLDAVCVNDIAEDSDGVLAFDALVTPYSHLERKMEVLNGVMGRTGQAVKPVAMQITDPFKQRGVANVAAIFELSDGQTVSIYFHNPDVNPNKMAGTDEVISWKWLLNKKDITIVVAPERGEDLNIREVARRIMKLAEKNSAAYQRANGKRTERMAAISGLKEEVAKLETELEKAQHELDVAKQEAEDSAVPNHYSQIILSNLVESFGWEVSNSGVSVKKDVGGGAVGGELNPTGSRVVYGVFDAPRNRYLALQVGMDEIFNIDCRDRETKEVAEEFDSRVRDWAASTAAKPADNLPATVSGEEYSKLSPEEVIITKMNDAMLALIAAKDGGDSSGIADAEKLMREAYGAEESTPMLKMSAAELRDLHNAVAGKPFAPIAPATADLTYHAKDDMFTSFLPNTPAGENAWRELSAQNGGDGNVLTVNAEEVAQQLRDKGFTVAKAAPATPFDKKEADELLAELSSGTGNSSESQNQDALIELTGKELGEFPDTKDGKKAMREAAIAEFDKMTAEDGGEWIKCAAISSQIELRRKSIKKIVSASADTRKLMIVPKIKEIIGSAKKVGEEKPNYDKDNYPNIVGYQTMRSPVKIDGEYLVIRFVIGRDDKGMYHYDHTVHDVEAIFDSANVNELTEVSSHDLMGGNQGCTYDRSDASEPTCLLPAEPSAEHQNGLSIDEEYKKLNVLDSASSGMVLNLFIEGEAPEEVSEEAEENSGGHGNKSASEQPLIDAYIKAWGTEADKINAAVAAVNWDGVTDYASASAEEMKLSSAVSAAKDIIPARDALASAGIQTWDSRLANVTETPEFKAHGDAISAYRAARDKMRAVAKEKLIEAGTAELSALPADAPLADVATAIFRKAGIEMGSNTPTPQIVTAIESKDSAMAWSILRNLDNKASAAIFERATGIKLAKTQRDRRPQIDAWAGITPEQRAEKDAAKDSAWQASELEKSVKDSWGWLKNMNVRDGAGTIDGQQYLLRQVAAGYNEVGTSKRGASIIYGVKKDDFELRFVKNKSFNAFLKAAQAFGGLKQALDLVGAVIPTVEAKTPVQIVDAAYQFASATDEFKEWLADYVAKESYSPFVSAKAMDEAAKRNGASIEWGRFGDTALDCATDDETLDAEAEWDSTPAVDEDGKECAVTLDGDYKGHPFHGNQHRHSSRESGAAMHASGRAKHFEQKGDTKELAKAHKVAHLSHAAALMTSTTEKTKHYHKTMAEFHAKQAGMKSVLDSVADMDGEDFGYDESEIGGTFEVEDVALDSATLDGIDQDGYVGKINKGGDTIGRVDIGDDGKAMVFVGATGDKRVVFASGVSAMYSDSDGADMVEAIFTVTQGAVNSSEKIAAPEAISAAPAEDPQKTADRALFQSIIDNTVSDILDASYIDKMEAAYSRHAGDAEMEALFVSAVDAYTAAELAASATL